MAPSPYKQPSAHLLLSFPLRFLSIFGGDTDQTLKVVARFQPSDFMHEDPILMQSFTIPLGTEHQAWIGTMVSDEGNKWSVEIAVSKVLSDAKLERVMGARQGPLAQVFGHWEFYPCDFGHLHTLLGDLLPEPLRSVRLEDCRGELLPEEFHDTSPTGDQIDTRQLVQILYRLHRRLC